MSRLSLLLASLLVSGCSSATGEPGSVWDEPVPTGDALSGCKGKASSSIPSSGTYVLTTFGGPSEPQPLACGGASKSGSWYYAASRQRYGCGAHVKITANGKCVVAQTDDYGPDVCVEKAAGYAVMDASPLVGKALFGESSLGWSDKRKVQVEEVGASTPLGPCATGSAGSGGSSGSGGGAPSGDSGGGGTPCGSDGDCNPGSNGSGLICVGGQCVPGCNKDWQCPGNTVCVSEQCQ